MIRKRLQLTIITLLLILTGCFSGTATAAGVNPLVSTKWLARHIGDKNLVLIDVRTANNYGVGHLPGAVSMPYVKFEPMNEDDSCRLMPSPAALTAMLRGLGVNSSSHVVVYDQGNTASDATKGAASCWVLESMGMNNVSYLDGGFTKWTFEGRIIDNKKPAPKAGDFTAKLDPAKVATLKEVVAASNAKNVILVDARNANEHFGATKSGEVERFGHIRGSLNMPAPYLTNAGINRAPATLKSKKVLAAIAAGIGLTKNKNAEIIVYCNSGQFAGLDYFVLHHILGYKNVSVFDGSMMEYASHEKLPLVRFAWGHVNK